MLEGRHVIGLFFLMLLFSGVFFTLGYVMGRNQFSGQVRAESAHNIDSPLLAHPETAAKHAGPSAAVEPATDAAPSSDWEFYHAGDKNASDNRLKSAPSGKTISARAESSAKLSNASSRRAASPSKGSRNSYSLQVAALSRQADAATLATALQKKRFPAYVVSPQGDKFFRVQVGPYADEKSAESARKGLESAGFKAIVKH